MIKFFYIIFTLLYASFAYSESSVKAGKSLIWDSENQSYTANGDVVFKNDKFIAYADKMIAKYVFILNLYVLEICIKDSYFVLLDQKPL